MTSVRGTTVAAARRRAAIVAVVAGFGLPVYFWVVGALVGGIDTPSERAPAARFVDYYVDEFSRIPVDATAAIVMWAIWLVVVLAVVRAACRRLDLAAIVAIALAGVATAVFVMAEGVLAWPTVGVDVSASRLRADLDPDVARAMVLSRDGLHAAAAVALGLAMFVVAWLLVRSDLWGRWVLGVLALLAGVSACSSIVVGPEGIGPGLVLLWGIVVAIVVLLGWRRWTPEEGADG